MEKPRLAVPVNTARAEIIDREALYSVLSTGRITGAIDVFHEEPLPDDDPIRRFPNVLLSPHMGHVTKEVYRILFSRVVDNILKWKAGSPYKNTPLEFRPT
jgi:phosphoglycerate dehydrogenase-like enzyme